MKLLQMGLHAIEQVKKHNYEVRMDKILSKALSATNKDEFFEVQIRKEAVIFNDREDRGSSEKMGYFQNVQSSSLMNVRLMI